MSVNIDQEFEQLKQDFLYHAKDLAGDLSSLLSEEKIDKGSFRELFRIVHSIKGGANSHEFTNLGTICHHFEDYLTLKLIDDLSNREYIEVCLRFIDIVEEVIRKTIKGEDVLFYEYLDEISHLQLPKIEQAHAQKRRILVVDNTKTIGTIVKKALEMQGYACTLTIDGLVAFNNLITRKYDALISSINLSPFDGISLVTALKSTNNINADIPVLIISASQNIEERFPNDFKPNKVVIKNEHFVNELQTSFEEIFSEKMTDTSDGPKHILYVEDDQKMQKLMALSMEKYSDVKLSIAHDIDSTLEILKTERPDVVILDNFLKNTSGYEVFLAIKAHSIPSIFLTASSSSVPVLRLKEHKEFLGIITKPFRPGAIYGQIKRFYNDRK